VPPPPAPSAVLLTGLAQAAGPVALVHTRQEALPAAGIDALVVEGPDLAQWYRVGARVLVPLDGPKVAGADDGSAATLVGVWLVGVRRSGEPFDAADLAALAHIGRLAAFQLDYARLAAGVARHRAPNAVARAENSAAATV
jgi:hypothetical protein